MERIKLTKEKCDELLRGLNRVRRHLCAYCPIEDIGKEKSYSDRFCDCKYGADHVGSHSESGNGCPEVRMAMDIVKAYCDLTNRPKRKRAPKRTDRGCTPIVPNYPEPL